MALSTYVLDQALLAIGTATRLDITNQLVTTFAAATTTNSLGSKTGITVGAPATNGNNRQVTIPAITDGNVNGTGTASHWALTDPANNRLIATGTLTSGQAVTTGNIFTLASFTISFPA